MGLEVNYFSLTMIFIIAFLSPLIAGRIKFISIPEILIQITAGVLIGNSGLNIIENSEIIDFLSSLGFVFLMFLSGYEVNLNLLRKKNKSLTLNPIKTALYISILTLLLSFLIAVLLFNLRIINNIFLLTLIFSTTSLGVVVSVLKENGIINNSFGQIVLITSLFADFSTLFLLPVVMYLIRSQMDYTILFSLILFVLFAAFFYILKLLHYIDFDKEIHKVTHLDVRVVLAVLFFFAILSETIGIEVVIGAFMAGMLFSLVLKNKSGHEELNIKLDSIGYGFLIPIFFIMIGVKFELSSVFTKETLIILPIILVIVYAVKLIPAFIVLRKDFHTKNALSAGFIISSRLSLIIAISAIALSNGVISMSLYSTFIIVSVVTCLISPIISLKLYDKNTGLSRHP